MHIFVADQTKDRILSSYYWKRGVKCGRLLLDFCNENVILFAVALLVTLVAAILVAWFQWQARHAEFGLFVSQGL